MAVRMPPTSPATPRRAETQSTQSQSAQSTSSTAAPATQTAPAQTTATPPGETLPTPSANIDPQTFGTNATRTLGQLQTQTFGAKQNLFGLIPGRLDAAVGLDVVLSQLAKSPNSGPLVQQMISTVEAQTGVKVPPALVSAAMANPERLADILKLTPAQMSAGLTALTAGQQAGRIAAVPPRARLLPNHFDFKDLDAVAYTRPESAPKEVAPGLFRGGFKNPLVDDKQAKANTVVAEVFDRLADNANLPPNERFSVSFNGSTFTRLDTFLDKLRQEGYEVTATVEHRVANFAELLTKDPATGAFLDVPAPLMVDVDLKNQQRVAVPSVHSEFVFNIRPGKNVKNPVVPESTIKWYQGVSATGFFPAELDKTPQWNGKSVTDTFTGDQAAKALELAGLMGDVINQAAKDQGLYASGYGLTGVCNDSVAILEMALTGRATGYPLLMQDALVKPEITKRLSDRNHRDDKGYQILLDAIEKVPSDLQDNPSRLDRALTSLPWEPGKEPFASTEAARAGLLSAGATAL